jgi:hypothetical protein
MAAPSAEQQNGQSDESDLQSPISTNDEDSETESGEGALPVYLVELIEKEIGVDLKSLKKVSALLEKLTAENKLLEEQVVSKRVVNFMLHTHISFQCCINNCMKNNRIVNNASIILPLAS